MFFLTTRGGDFFLTTRGRLFFCTGEKYPNQKHNPRGGGYPTLEPLWRRKDHLGFWEGGRRRLPKEGGGRFSKMRQERFWEGGRRRLPKMRQNRPFLYYCGGVMIQTVEGSQFDVVVERQPHLVGCRSQLCEAIRVRFFITIPGPFHHRHALFYTIPRLILRR